MLKELTITGAREHNLQNVSLTIPRDELIVITGLSGSGKSSLAFDTIYAEGQRRYVESLSAYARQFLEMMEKPDVDEITGLSPAISIEQKTTSKNPRSTVGTVTEIYDYMRLLWARVGIPYSPATGEPIQSQSATEMVDKIFEMGEGAKLYLMAPVVRNRKGAYEKQLRQYQAKGFQRVKIDGEIYEIDDVPELDRKRNHDIFIVVDRVIVREDIGNRLADSVETALRLSEGLLIVENAETGEEHIFSEKFACPVSGFTIPEIEPRLFSFNSPQGACPTCDGIGTQRFFDPGLVVPDDHKSLANNAVEPWSKTYSNYYLQTLEALCRHYKQSMRKPWRELPEDFRNTILYGSGDEEITFTYHDGLREYTTTKAFEGVIRNLERRMVESSSDSVRDDLAKYQTTSACSACIGHRLKPEALAVKIAGHHIGEAADMSIEAAYDWFGNLEPQLSHQQAEIGRRILKEINDRLTFLMDVGLEYLTIGRGAASLSGGESQRIRLASQIGSGLTGVLYVLDEPSIGLHQRDNNRLLNTLKRLRDLGNSVLVVEHDEDAIRAADHLIDMGPGAGLHGGHVVAQGTPAQIMENGQGLTADYLTGRKQIPVPAKRRTPKKSGNTKQAIRLKGASGFNLQNITVDFPLGTFTCITGVSGSGKSTLTINTLYKAIARTLMRSKDNPAPYEAIRGLEYLDKVIDIDQSPIGRTPRSNPATYTGAFNYIREWFANLPESKARGYSAGRFSFNVKGGRCETCQGDGMIRVEMHFLPDIFVTCEACNGKRFNRETLEITYKEHSIADILEMSIEDGAEFFKSVPNIRDKLETLKQVGLGYVKIGQPATTLSGGEAQRVKLSRELAKKSTGSTLYILDEPTTGLHFDDVRQLLDVLHTLVDQGNTVLVIEHNLEVIKTADHIIDVGPEGGARGGEIVATGTPEQIADASESYTGYYLSAILGREAKAAAE